MNHQLGSNEQSTSLRTLFNEGRFEEVELKARALLHSNPLSGEAWLILGVAQLSQDRQALPALKRAVSLLPGLAEAHCNLGVALERLGKLHEAEASYRKALVLDPRSAHAHCSLGNALQNLDRIQEAIDSYSAALAIDPIHVKANHCLRTLYSNVGKLVEAEQLCRNTLQIRPDFDEVRHCLAVTLAYLSQFDTVVEESDRAMARHPDHPVMWEQRLYCFSYHPDLSAEDIYKEFVRWGKRFPNPSVDFNGHDRNQDRRLRVGYVSPDFRAHSSRFYFWPLFSNHNRQDFEWFAYSNVQREVPWTQQFRSQFKNWRDIRNMNDEEVSELIQADRIDILVDLCGHMEGERLGVFALKPAPIQATWLGSAWTTGLKTIDYALFDHFVAPEGTLSSESIIRLPHSFMVFEPPADTAGIQPPPCLKVRHPTFGYSGRTERLNHRTFRVWGEILERLPEARLVLDYPSFGDPGTQLFFRSFMASHGVDTDRVIMRRSSNIFHGLNDIDILLDSFPHGGGTMLMDALWMGVPFVTLASRPPVGRLGLGMLMNLGLPEWVAYTEEEYIEKACAFAGDPERLNELRLGMRERMRNSPLMDGPGFARAIESAYRLMFDRWARGLPSSGNPDGHPCGGVS